MAINALRTAPAAPGADRAGGDQARAAAYLPAGEMEAGRLLLPASQALPPVTRLVVLVPEADLDEATLARHVWKMAAPRQLAVLYLGWSAAADTEAPLRRRLANLAALTRDDGVVVSARPALGAGWLPALRGVWRPGDLVVAHSEQQVRLWGLVARPLGAALLAALNAPVYVLTGFCPAPVRPALSVAAQMLSGLMFGLVVAVFFGLQSAILQLPGRPIQTMLLLASIVVEYGLLWGWNRLSG
jgi:hypothetical protein